jgi:hypothetical protein
MTGGADGTMTVQEKQHKLVKKMVQTARIKPEVISIKRKNQVQLLTACELV